jgi:hypothetical protein
MRFLLAMSAVVGVCGSAALATPINYGDFTGTNVMFLQVTEDSTTDATPLFGTPLVSGDGIQFNPTSFGSFAFNGSSDLTDGTLTTMIMANPGRVIPAVTFSESGDYTLAGSGGAMTSASVALSWFVTVSEVNGSPIAPVSFSGMGTFSPSSGTFDLASDGPGAAVIWNGSAMIDIDAFLASQSISGSATKVTVTLNNALVTTSEPGTASFIKKKEFGGVAMAVVPAPATLGLLGVGLVAAGRRRR